MGHHDGTPRGRWPEAVPLSSFDDVEEDECGNLDSCKDEQDEANAIDFGLAYTRPGVSPGHVPGHRREPVARAEQAEREEAAPADENTRIGAVRGTESERRELRRL